MIKIQHWKVFGSHYNDNSELGMEIKKCQLDSRKYEGMGVPISQSVMETIRSQNRTSVYPYLYFGTSMDDYNEAMYFLDKKQCVTEYECRKMDASKKHEIITTESPFFDTSHDDVTEMICAAMDPPCLVSSPLKGSNLFPDQLNGSNLFPDMFTPIKNGVISAKDQSLYISPTTREFQRHLQSAAETVNEVYNKHRTKIIRKNLIESIDHILDHDLVSENPAVGRFVTELSRSINNVKYLFNRAVFEASGENFYGKDDELVYPAFTRKKTTSEHKRSKGLTG
jgi:hypothetical protein